VHLACRKGIFRVSEKELEDFAAGKVHTVTSIPFSTGQLRFECRSGVQPAAWRTHDGRLWFSTTNGLVEIDPNHLRSNRVPPPVRITTIIVNGQRLRSSQNLQLKSSEKNVEIRYAGLSFISPEKVTFRYMLEGYDKTWTDAGPRRSAFFTNLPPGNFRFRVLACNADGIWSVQPASLNFTIEPKLYQRGWFLTVLALAFGLIVFAAHRMRVRHLQHRFDLILAERSRIARELHDTLLQGLSGITMQLQALWIKLPASREKQLLGDIIKDAAAASSEARQSLWGLRTIGPGPRDFAEKLAELSRQATAGKPVKLSLDLQPLATSLGPDTEYQLLRIAHEAISNSLKHANAKRLEIRLNTDMHGLQLTLSDDGVGFDSEAEYRFGHFGLVGMRERAEEIGANLKVISSPGCGTAISVSLPLSCAGTPERNRTPALEHQIK
jgi:signal transduction histidine kinase